MECQKTFLRLLCFLSLCGIYESYCRNLDTLRNGNISEKQFNDICPWLDLNIKSPSPQQEAQLMIIPDIIHQLQWTHVTILFQSQTRNEIIEISSELHAYGILTISHEIAKDKEYMATMWENRDPDVHVLVLGDMDFICKTLEEANRFDKTEVNRRRTALYMKSFWIISPTVEHTINYFRHEQYSLDNVLLLDVDYYGRYKLYTLMWRQKNRREFENIKNNNATVIHLFPNVRFGFNGRQLIISSLEWKDVVELSDNNTVISGGLCGELLAILSEKLNFTHKVVMPLDNQYGNLVNGSWSGIVGQLHRREADLAVTALSIRQSRSEVIDYTVPFFYEYSSFLIRMPDAEDTKWRIYLNPFSMEVIIAIFSILTFSSLLLYTLERVSNRLIGSDNVSSTVGAFMDIFFYLYGAVFLQAGDALPESNSSRAFAGFFWISCVSIAAVYCGSLAASMAVLRKQPMPFETLEELTAQSEYNYGYDVGTFRDLAFKTSPVDVHKRIYEKAYKTADEKLHFHKVKTEKYVFIAGVTYLSTISFSDCRLQISPDRFLGYKGAFGFPKGSPFKHIFSDKLTQLQDNGLIFKIEQKYRFKERDHCSSTNTLRKKTIQLEEAQSAFYILLTGTIAAAVVLSIECVMQRIFGRQT